MKRCDQYPQSFRDVKIKDVMTKNLIVASPDDDLDYVESIMTQNRVRHPPIIENNKLAGIISIGDAVNMQRGECKMENRYLKDYISGNIQAEGGMTEWRQILYSFHRRERHEEIVVVFCDYHRFCFCGAD